MTVDQGGNEGNEGAWANPLSPPEINERKDRITPLERPLNISHFRIGRTLVVAVGRFS